MISQVNLTQRVFSGEQDGPCAVKEYVAVELWTKEFAALIFLPRALEPKDRAGGSSPGSGYSPWDGTG